MSEQQDAGGVHYHYHFYGNGAPGAGGPGPTDYAGSATPGGPFGYGPGPVPPGMAPPPPFPGGGPAYAGATGTAAGNAHPHPNADSLVKGLLVGAGVAYLLTNETAQRTILRTAVQAWAVVQNSLAEMKERLHDAEAEVAAEATETEPADPDRD